MKSALLQSSTPQLPEMKKVDTHKHSLVLNLDSHQEGNKGCKFMLGYKCDALPASVKHRWDKHPLILHFPPHIRDTDEGEEFYCEVCEDEIHPKHWMYRCVECDHSFHPRCIPTLGDSRNIKFGKTESIKSHPHHLTLVPQAKLTSLCRTCQKSLHWSKAFECAHCGFYLCLDCIPQEELVVELS